MIDKIVKNKPLLLLLLTGAVFFFLKYISPLIAPILMAMLFVTIFGPLLKKLQEKLHLHRQIGAVILLVFACSISIGILWILFVWLTGEISQWSGRADLVMDECANLVHSFCNSIGEICKWDQSSLERTLLGQIHYGIAYMEQHAMPGIFTQSVAFVKLLTQMGAFLITFIIAAVLLAKDYDHIMNKMLDNEDCHVVLDVICGMIRYIATFVKAQIIIMGTVGMIAVAILGLSGIKDGVLWGLLTGVLDLFPFIGTGIVLLPLAIFQFFRGEYLQGSMCLLLYMICVFLREMMEPRLIGKRVGVTPVAILVSLYAGIQLFGVWGILKGPLGFIMIYESYQSLVRRR